MKQGKLEVVNREMARVNVDILGIRELKWTEPKQKQHSVVGMSGGESKV